jgi:hypothetical protein
LDRLIQQALNQVLQPLFDPEFSVSSYGFRPGRNAHQAVQAAQGYVAAGKRWVHARAKNLMRAGTDEVRAWRSATNQRGPWWNGGASHMNAAYPKSWFDRMGLVSLLEVRQRLTSAS